MPGRMIWPRPDWMTPPRATSAPVASTGVHTLVQGVPFGARLVGKHPVSGANPSPVKSYNEKPAASTSTLPTPRGVEWAEMITAPGGELAAFDDALATAPPCAATRTHTTPTAAAHV